MALKNMTDTKRKPTISFASESDALRLSVWAAKRFHQTYTDSMPAGALKTHIAEDFGVTQQRTELLDPNITTLLVEIENEVVGYAQLRLKPIPVTIDYDVTAELWRIYVDKSCHGLGVGRQLLCRVGEIARERSHDKIWLGVWEHNVSAIAFYQKLGFSVVGEHVFNLGGEVQNDFVCVGDTSAFQSSR
jgi:ribosomal protein S18 acetylase RimI-like enzyme